MCGVWEAIVYRVHAGETVGGSGKLEAVPGGVDKERSQSIGGRGDAHKAHFPVSEGRQKDDPAHSTLKSDSQCFYFFLPVSLNI